MMRLTLLLAAAVPAMAFATAAFAASVTQSFPATGFDRVTASGSEDITIVTGKAASVTATGDAERIARLRIGVEGTTLKIDHKSSSNWGMQPGEPVRIVITMPALLGLHGSGAGDITADRGSGPAFSASTSGSGDMRIAQIDSAVVTLHTSGSGDIAAAGQCTTAKVSTSGSGDLAIGNLACRDIDVTITGSGDVGARASGNANVKISGSGDVAIAGGARCMSRTSGSGDVKCS
jgi:hypothetical protein